MCTEYGILWQLQYKGDSVRRHAVWIMIAMATCPPAFSFEVDELKSGMSFDAARSLIEKRYDDRVEIKDGHIETWDTPDRASARTIFLNFCKGRLVQVVKHLQPRFDYFVRLADEKRRELGRPLDAWSRPTDITSSNESNAIELIWRDRLDFVSVAYTQFSSNNQLDITYDARNSCWRIPY